MRNKKHALAGDYVKLLKIGRLICHVAFDNFDIPRKLPIISEGNVAGKGYRRM
jgi:hypothetical protein